MTKKEKINKEISLLDNRREILYKDLQKELKEEHKELLKERAKVLRSYIGKKVVIKTFKDYIVCVVLKVTRQPNQKYAPFRIYAGNYVSFARTQVDFKLEVTNVKYSNDSRCGWFDASEEEDGVVLYDESPVKNKFNEMLEFMKNF